MAGCETDHRPRRIFLIAVEEFADRLGAALMRAVRAAAGDGTMFEGVGGDEMMAAGLVASHRVHGMDIMGFTAIPRVVIAAFRQIHATADAVIAATPDVLVIIDNPEFTHRVARQVQARAPQIPIVNYVSPQLWAWRAGRARAMRRYVDHVLALLPFEPQVMARLGGPPTTHVGHPLAEQADVLRPNSDETHRRDSLPPLVLVLPGSRPAEIRRLLGVFEDTIKLAAARCGELEVVVPTVPKLLDAVTASTAAWEPRPRIVVGRAEHRAAFRNARAALAASGTVTLELALAGVPTVVAYRIPLIEFLAAKLLLRLPSIVLANLVLGENVMPEFIQRAASPERLAAALGPLLGDTPQRRAQTAAFERLDAVMDIGGRAPSAKAADIVLEAAARGAYLRREIGW